MYDKPKPLSKFKRILYFTTGLVIASALIVYGISWTNPPFELMIIGLTLNEWITAAFVVILGLLAGSLIKSGILGKTRLD